MKFEGILQIVNVIELCINFHLYFTIIFLHAIKTKHLAVQETPEGSQIPKADSLIDRQKME